MFGSGKKLNKTNSKQSGPWQLSLKISFQLSDDLYFDNEF
jgi:hypothetical protein